MASRSVFEQFDATVEKLLAGGKAGRARTTVRLAAMQRVAADLHGLPRADFKSRLRRELSAGPVAGAARPARVEPIRPGFHTITPYVAVHEAPQVLEFVKQVFGAEEMLRSAGSGGGMHAEVRIGDSMVMIGGGGAYKGPTFPTAMHVYVPNTDEAYRRALEAGVKTLRAPEDMFYGERSASVVDVAGNHWYLATRFGKEWKPEHLHSVQICLLPVKSMPVIEFLKSAFGAESLELHETPGGGVKHATLRIGSSTVEIGDAHGPYQPMPTMFYLYVDDVDVWYARAVAAGAKPGQPPAEMPYGDRVGNVTDPFGNQWYIASHVRDVPLP
jgi:PhnB protein